MDIVIVSQYLRNIENLEGNNSRFIYLANMLSENGENEVEIVTSNFMHGSKRHAIKVQQSGKFKITALEEPGYSKNVCLKRFYSHFILAQNIKDYLKERKKPDCIYCAVPSLDVAKEVSKYCKKNGVRFVVDIQDLWPEAFKMVLNIPILSNLIFAPMKCEADAIYRQADEIVAVSSTYCERALKLNHKCREGYTAFLGTKLDVFDQNTKIKTNIEKKENRLWLMYCGSLGHSYDLPTVFDALEIIKDKGKETPYFVIMGDGPKKEEFEKYAANKGVDCLFTGQLSYQEMCAVLVKGDIVVNPIIASSPASIINKHGDYAASGLPVLNTQTSKEYRNLIDEYQMGFNCLSENAEDLSDKMIELIENSKLRVKMGRNARKCAEERFDRKHSYKKICDIILGVTNESFNNLT